MGGFGARPTSVFKVDPPSLLWVQGVALTRRRVERTPALQRMRRRSSSGASSGVRQTMRQFANDANQRSARSPLLDRENRQNV
jgi:hypothetical protein